MQEKLYDYDYGRLTNSKVTWWKKENNLKHTRQINNATKSHKQRQKRYLSCKTLSKVHFKHQFVFVWNALSWEF